MSPSSRFSVLRQLGADLRPHDQSRQSNTMSVARHSRRTRNSTRSRSSTRESPAPRSALLFGDEDPQDLIHHFVHAAKLISTRKCPGLGRFLPGSRSTILIRESYLPHMRHISMRSRGSARIDHPRRNGRHSELAEAINHLLAPRLNASFTPVARPAITAPLIFRCESKRDGPGRLWPPPASLRLLHPNVVSQDTASRWPFVFSCAAARIQ